jgi:hypothetical protein
MVSLIDTWWCLPSTTAYACITTHTSPPLLIMPPLLLIPPLHHLSCLHYYSYLPSATYHASTTLLLMPPLLLIPPLHYSYLPSTTAHSSTAACWGTIYRCWCHQSISARRGISGSSTGGGKEGAQRGYFKQITIKFRIVLAQFSHIFRTDFP